MELDRYVEGDSPFHRADARIKFILTIGTILMISLLPIGSFLALGQFLAAGLCKCALRQAAAKTHGPLNVLKREPS